MDDTTPFDTQLVTGSSSPAPGRGTEPLTAPTLVLHGSKDPEMPDQELHELLDALPDAEPVSLTGESACCP